jgi:dipeptidyl aminopeptidase/acylaminoacyl peptidase
MLVEFNLAKSDLISWLAAFSVGVLLGGNVAHSELPPLVPRELLFGSPTNSKNNPRISPNGKYLAYIAPAPDSLVYNVWLQSNGKQDDRVITQEKKRPVYACFWQPDSEHILYYRDGDGDENTHIYQVDIRTQNTRDLTPFVGVQAELVALNPNIPDEMLVAMNWENRKCHDVYRLNLKSGAMELDTRNPGDVWEWTADNRNQVRAAKVITPDGGTEIRVRASPKAKWRSFQTWGPDECSGTVQGGVWAFTPNNKGVWIISSVGANTNRLMEFDVASGKGKVIAQDPNYDVYMVQVNPTRYSLDAVAFYRERLDWTLLDKRLEEDYRILKTTCQGELRVWSRDLADTKWIVAHITDNRVNCYYLYDRATRKADLVFSNSPDMLKYTFSHRQPISFTARDGLVIHGYLTLPVGVEPKKLPMILRVHGGPESRDGWAFDWYAQWLANRGYAVLQINFRGSTGYGKSFHNAGDREWGGKMLDDLIDGKRWAVEQGYADPKRVAIMGHSYGGYAALAGLAFTPDEFVCGVDESGPANLITLLQSTPEYWAPTLGELKKHIGDWEKDTDSLKARSPAHHANRIKAPLFVVQGANDPYVKQAESDQIVQAVRQNGTPVQYLLFPDEGHAIERPENDMKCRAAEEVFLAKYLGGRLEPASEKEKCDDLMK